MFLITPWDRLGEIRGEAGNNSVGFVQEHWKMKDVFGSVGLWSNYWTFGG